MKLSKTYISKLILYPLIFVLFSILLASCGSYRKVIKEPLKLYGSEYLFEQMKENEVRPDFLTSRFSAEIRKDNKQMSFNGQLRLKTDSIIWLTVSPALGLEIGRLIITTDSVKWLNRLESNYMINNINWLNEVIHPLIDFDLVQALILGNDLSYYENSMFRGSIENHEYKLTINQRRKLKKKARSDDGSDIIPLQQIWLDPETYKIKKVMIKDLKDKGARIEAVYDNFVESGNYLFSTKRIYELQEKNTNLTLKLSFTRTEIPESNNFPFTIPEKYRPVRN